MTIHPQSAHSAVHRARVVSPQEQSSYAPVFPQVRAHARTHSCGKMGGSKSAGGALRTLNPGLTTATKGQPMVSPDSMSPTARPWRGTPYPSIRLAVYAKSDYKCAHCGWAPEIPEGYTGRYALYGRVPRRNGTLALWSLDLDHIHPYSAGGRFTLDNLQALCTSCNNKKGARV